MDLLDRLNEEDCFRLGETAERLAMATRDENRAGSLALVRQARHSLRIVSREFDGPLYANAPFVDAVSAIARRGRNSTIRILITNSDPIVHHGHLLIELARRLSSSIQIRRLGKVVRDHNRAFLVVDETGVLHRPQADLYEGAMSFNDPGQAKLLSERFEELWEQSAPDPELRRLHV